MDYNITPISNSELIVVSETVLQYQNDFNFINQGAIDKETHDRCSNMPQSYYLADLTHADCTPIEVKKVVTEVIETLEQPELNCNLAVYYPTGGYIGWHTNGNFNVYNAICTFSESGESSFIYSEQDSIVEVPDNIGWTVKKTFWSKNNSVPHYAHSECNRITLAFSSTNERVIDSFIESLL